MDVLDDLEAEQDRIDGILDLLDDASWAAPSGAAGWSVADVVLHLAQTEEAVVASTAGRSLLEALPDVSAATSMDDAMERWVAAERSTADAAFDRWRRARVAAVAALRATDPEARLPWAAAPLRPRALATTRLAEHWAHGLDVTGPLGIEYPDTDRLRHVVWLGFQSLPYAWALAGEPPGDVYCELVSPDGTTTWAFGDPASESRIEGAAGAFCRVGARRLAPGAAGLKASGPRADAALRVLRNYAG